MALGLAWTMCLSLAGCGSSTTSTSSGQSASSSSSSTDTATSETTSSSNLPEWAQEGTATGVAAWNYYKLPDDYAVFTYDDVEFDLANDTRDEIEKKIATTSAADQAHDASDATTGMYVAGPKSSSTFSLFYNVEAEDNSYFTHMAMRRRAMKAGNCTFTNGINAGTTWSEVKDKLGEPNACYQRYDTDLKYYAICMWYVQGNNMTVIDDTDQSVQFDSFNYLFFTYEKEEGEDHYSLISLYVGCNDDTCKSAQYYTDVQIYGEDWVSEDA